MSSYAFPEAEANRGFLWPLFGDYIGATARNGHLWIGYTDTSRSGSYGYGTQSLHESNNNVVAEDYWYPRTLHSERKERDLRVPLFFPPMLGSDRGENPFAPSLSGRNRYANRI